MHFNVKFFSYFRKFLFLLVNLYTWNIKILSLYAFSWKSVKKLKFHYNNRIYWRYCNFLWNKFCFSDAVTYFSAPGLIPGSQYQFSVLTTADIEGNIESSAEKVIQDTGWQVETQVKLSRPKWPLIKPSSNVHSPFELHGLEKSLSHFCLGWPGQGRIWGHHSNYINLWTTLQNAHFLK